MNLAKYKEVISNAIQGEIEAKEFYENIAKRIKDKFLKELFGNFAMEEAKHEKILTRILTQEKMDKHFFNFDKDFKPEIW